MKILKTNYSDYDVSILHLFYVYAYVDACDDDVFFLLLLPVEVLLFVEFY